VVTAVCHSVSQRILSFEAWLCFPGRLHVICDGQIGAATGLLSSESLLFLSLSHHSVSS
jgi:hypothetical protein